MTAIQQWPPQQHWAEYEELALFQLSTGITEFERGGFAKV